ncbi:MAG: thiamine phosphate synthase [Lachnospiraceae bacterium]|nr:thiamine phosphate synthase [Lachnospiraceae bacterium]
MDRDILSLYAITDRRWLKNGERLEDKVEEAILGGAGIVQYREKELKGDELKSQALRIKEVCNRYEVPLIINDDAELAADIDADGVHVGRSDIGVADARRILGNGKIIGATAKTVDQAREAYALGADYLGSGAVFGSETKTDAKYMSPELLGTIAESVPVPVVAIGGIDETNVSGLKGLSIAGVAVIHGIFGRRNVRQGAAAIRGHLYGRPVVQCITNHVTVNDVANVVLAMGASPIMAHHIKEVSEVQEKAAALLLNLGATDDYDAMKEAMKTAVKYSHPVIIDPVGTAVSSFRRNQAEELLKIGIPACIRGNYSEILALCKEEKTLNGLDDDRTYDNIEEMKEVVCEYAGRIGTVVAASGVTDIISDGKTTVCIETGHSMQRQITGSGCMLSAAIASQIALCSRATLPYIAGTCKYIGDRAANAANEMIREEKGSMSFRTCFIDSL